MIALRSLRCTSCSDEKCLASNLNNRVGKSSSRVCAIAAGAVFADVARSLPLDQRKGGAD